MEMALIILLKIVRCPLSSKSRWALADLRIHNRETEEMDNSPQPEAATDTTFKDVVEQLVSNYSVLRRGSSDWLQFARSLRPSTRVCTLNNPYISVLESIAQDLTTVVDALRNLIGHHQVGLFMNFSDQIRPVYTAFPARVSFMHRNSIMPPVMLSKSLL